MQKVCGGCSTDGRWGIRSFAGTAAQQEASPPSSFLRQSLEDALRWTGPILTAGAATLPRGHFLIEPNLRCDRCSFE